jgi:hypothetical protein
LAKRHEFHPSNGDIEMTPEELRLECLKLVLQSANTSGLPLAETSQLISRARAYADFVLNSKDRGGVDSDNATPTLRMPVAEGLCDTLNIASA